MVIAISQSSKLIDRETMDEKAKRTKYIRALERFMLKILPTLKNDKLSNEEFITRIASSYKFMKDIEKQRLDSSYLRQIEDIVQKLLDNCNGEIADLNELQKNLIKEWNLAKKSKNKATYKKEKHKNINLLPRNFQEIKKT